MSDEIEKPKLTPEEQEQANALGVELVHYIVEGVEHWAYHNQVDLRAEASRAFVKAVLEGLIPLGPDPIIPEAEA